MTTRIAIPLARVLVLGGLLVLAACGKQGQLERPGPLFGAKERAEYARERAAARRAAGEASPDSSATSQTNGDYSQANDGAKDPALRPLRTDPPLGGGNGPGSSRATGGGVLPDPYADPNTTPR